MAFEKARDSTQARVQSHMRLINLELESAGNVRVEESSGTGDCLWYTSCCELLQSRFDPAAAAAGSIGASSIHIRNISRVHNRPLRLRMEGAVRGEEYTTEYLLWSPQSGDMRSVETVVQHGLTSCSALGEYATHMSACIFRMLLYPVSLLLL